MHRPSQRPLTTGTTTPQMYTPLVPGGVGTAGPTSRLSTWKAVLGIFLPSLLVFVILDGIWIGLVASDFYQSRLKPILKPTDPLAAALSWACIVGINQVFVLPRNIHAPSAFSCLAQGAAMGLLLYGTVDLTNAALLSGWSWLVAVVDMAWGTTACAMTAVVQLSLHNWLTTTTTSSSSRGPAAGLAAAAERVA